jgi:two-component system sensor histidine kinase CreC
MKIGLRILLSYFLILGLSAWFVLNVFVAEVKPGVRATLEDTLVDTAQLLAQLVADDVSNGDISQAKLLTRMQSFASRSINVKISNVQKQNLDYRITITNDVGIVIFDSEKKDVGKDYSKWNDVYLTLRGKYGARSTRVDPLDDNSSVMHVAAPIMDSQGNGKIIGVLTVAKPISTIGPFIERSQKKIMQRSFWILLATLLIGLGFTWWLTRSLQHLQTYALKVQNNEKASLPNLGNNEIGELGKALESMRNQLEGKAYVEQLMHTLTHELKSPIAAIQGSAELLKEEMPPTDRERFLNNIIEQNQRQKQLIEKLLDLVKIEKQQSLDQKTLIHLPTLLEQIKNDTLTNLSQNNLRLSIQNKTEYIQGDNLLMRQAIDNLIDNAIAFSPSESEIQLIIQGDEKYLNISVVDQGSGIPAYAEDKIFDRFYSLPRQNSGKSTGLGLPFVKEVALLHGGTIKVHNQLDNTGVVACLRLPI